VTNLDSLGSRDRRIRLFERYGALLTDHQRAVLELHLRRDWSLSEIAQHQRTSRSAVHDLVRRATAALGEYERRLGLVAQEARRRESLSELSRDLARLVQRLGRLEAAG
jgi:predicted DNA-binding protein YlxM (UPF0122 family)